MLLNGMGDVINTYVSKHRFSLVELAQWKHNSAQHFILQIGKISNSKLIQYLKCDLNMKKWLRCINPFTRRAYCVTDDRRWWLRFGCTHVVQTRLPRSPTPTSRNVLHQPSVLFVFLASPTLPVGVIVFWGEEVGHLQVNTLAARWAAVTAITRELSDGNGQKGHHTVHS